MGRRERLIQAKWDTLLGHASRAKLRTFIETGTLRGDTIAYMLPHFDRLITIDINANKWSACKARFATESTVNCLLGDSRLVLSEVLESLYTPALFWLDAHYFTDAESTTGNLNIPIMEELDAITSHELADSHVIVIDDAKVFIDWKHRTDAFPHYRDIEELILSRHPTWLVQTRVICENPYGCVIEAYNDNDAKTW